MSEQEDVIKGLSKELSKARLDYENRGLLNTYGLKCSQQLEQQAEYDYSRAIMLHAEKKLEYAISHFANKPVDTSE